MTDARDENGELLPDEDRLPSFGQKLRNTSLDELPELINIWKGNSSIIGTTKKTSILQGFWRLELNPAMRFLCMSGSPGLSA